MVATPEQLTRFEFQKPTFATIAHQQLMGYRNPVEGTNADAKRRHGLRHDTCLAPGLIPHALAAAISAAVRTCN